MVDDLALRAGADQSVSSVVCRPAWPGSARWWRQARPALTAGMAALGLHLLWLWLLAGPGGDLAAQDAWAQFAGRYPDSAYTLSWYGGMHPGSYSLLSPYVMSALGVRTTLVLAGVLSAGILGWLLGHSRHVQRPTWPALAGAVALTGNAVSGRATFALGVLFALLAVAACVVVPDLPNPTRRAWLRAGMAAAAILATASSPMAGLFLGLVAAALLLTSRWADSLALGLPPAVVVGVSTVLFPAAGVQPMDARSTIVPLMVSVAVVVMAPRDWRTVRAAAGLYATAILAAWLLPSPIGSNIVRLGLLFGGVVLLAAGIEIVGRSSRRRRQLRGALPAAMAVLALGWQAGVAGADVAHSRPATAEQAGLHQLVTQLEDRHAELSRVEVVPTADHSEMASLAPFFALARGWNRQADFARNPLFYRQVPLTESDYHRWLRKWAVGFVAIADAEPDLGAAGETAIVRSHPAYLKQVWRSAGWTLYSVRDARPIVEPPGRVLGFDPAQITISTPVSGPLTVRILYSPWLALVDSHGHAEPTSQRGSSCLGRVSAARALTGGRSWVVLHAAQPGIYRIAAPYSLPRGAACLVQ